MTTIIETGEGRFTAEVAGPADGPLVLMLHGFPQSRHSWRDQVPALGAAGYRAVAFDQRGYSPGARPSPSDLPTYRLDRLVADVLDVATAAAAAVGSVNPGRFHLVGHDWGGQVAWATAATHPDRIASLMVLSRPHPAAFAEAFREDADGQRQRSRHHRAFDDPQTAQKWLADGARVLRRGLGDQGVPTESVDEYVSVLGSPDAFEAALAWYRAATAGLGVAIGPVHPPTRYLWGDADSSVGRRAAELTASSVVGPYRFVELAGVGHFVTDQAPAVVTGHLLEHLAAHPHGTVAPGTW